MADIKKVKIEEAAKALTSAISENLTTGKSIEEILREILATADTNTGCRFGLTHKLRDKLRIVPFPQIESMDITN